MSRSRFEACQNVWGSFDGAKGVTYEHAKAYGIRELDLRLSKSDVLASEPLL